MSDESFNQPSEHEREVAEEEHERAGEGAVPEPESTYEREVEAERRGTSADKLNEGGDDADAPVDSAYRPRTG